MCLVLVAEMHILIGMAVTTVLIIGWAMGNLFCAVFLSLAPAAGALILLAQKTGPSPWALACFALIAVIWAPRYLPRLPERRRLAKIARQRRRDYLTARHPDPAPAPDMSLLKAIGVTVAICLSVTVVMMPFFYLSN